MREYGILSVSTLCIAICALLTGLSTVNYAATTIYVDDDAAAGGDGLSWAAPYDDLQKALDAAFYNSDVNEIRVAGGIYYPDRGTGIRAWTFQLVDGVALQGGYRGLADGGDPDDRDIITFESILSGDIGIEDLTTDNSYHVVSATGTGAATTFDGFTVTKGQADGSAPHNDGAGFYNADGAPVISYCQFTNNYATNNGAGVHYVMMDPGTDFTLTGCVFDNNIASGNGGGMYFISSATACNLISCTITYNTASGNGGGFYIRDADGVTLSDCNFVSNVASTDGGGLDIDTSGDATLTNCSVSSNQASYYGGGMKVNGGDLTLSNCYYDSNNTIGDWRSYGGGVWTGSDATLTDCTFATNNVTGASWAISYGGGIYVSGTTTIVGCTFIDNTAYSSAYRVTNRGGAIWASIADIQNSTFSGNSTNSENYDCGWGGAIFTNDATIYDCIFDNNTSIGNTNYSTGRGGAIWTGVADIKRCVFTSNSATGSGANSGSGGAIWVENNISKIASCTFESNSAEQFGGSIFTNKGAAEIASSTFTSNSTSTYDGGAIYSEQTAMILSGNSFDSNTAEWQGGAFKQSEGSADIDNCTFNNNTAIDFGGAVFHNGTSQSIARSTFEGNTSDTDGGAVYLDNGCSPIIDSCLMLSNSALGSGGALVCGNGSSPTLANSIVSGNTADFFGGGLYLFNSSDVAVVNSTLWFNTAPIVGGGIYIDNCLASVNGSILRDNSYDQIYDINHLVAVNYTNIEGGYPTGDGIIDADPLWTDPLGVDGIAGTLDDDHRLLAGSPCIDAGDNDAVPLSIMNDLDGNTRFTNDLATVDTGNFWCLPVDMGTYEYTGTTMCMQAPSPGTAGEDNTFAVTGATPNKMVYFVYGLQAGSKAVPGCPDLIIKIKNPQLFGNSKADQNGDAAIVVPVPAAAAGKTILFQAVTKATCEMSNRVIHEFL